jgi:energy-converting hydrogenase A subunit M
MTDFIYEKDLTNMKLKILSSPFHSRMVDELSKKYCVSPSQLRKILMENFDMSLLENLPARYNAWKSDAYDSELDREIGARLFVSYIPLIGGKDAEAVLDEARAGIESGKDREATVSNGIKEIAGMIRR